MVSEPRLLGGFRHIFALGVVLIAPVTFAACGDSSDSGAGPEEENVPVTRADEMPAEAPSEGEPQVSEDERRYIDEMREYQSEVASLTSHTDLIELLHLADIEHHGLFIDFGTPSRMKYTGGQWRNDWGADRTVDNASVTALGEAGSVYFARASREALKIRFRVRRAGAESLVAYLNGETIRTVDLRDGMNIETLEIPAEHVIAGENSLRFRASGLSGNTSADLDWMTIAAADEEASEAGPGISFDQLRARVELSGDTRSAVVVPGGACLTYHVDIPRGAKFAFAFGQMAEASPSPSGPARLTLRLTPSGGGETTTLFEGSASGRWSHQRLDLSAHAGQVVRLDFQTDGAGRVAMSDMRLLTTPAPELPGQARNVVVLTIDTLRASKLRVYNRRSRVRTPVIDTFANEAMVFEHAHSPENWTKPSVASILTSLFPSTHRTKEDSSSLPADALMVSEVFQREDFSTASFLANGYVSDRFGFRQGWDHYRNYIREERPTHASNVFSEAGDWIEQHQNERFFVYIQTIDPHVPYDPPDRFLRMYDASTDYSGQVQPRRTAQLLADAKRRPPRVTFDDADLQRLTGLHDGEISYHDFHLGRFIERLKSLGLYDDMIFVITSDHGEEFGEHESWGHGHSIFQELLHVPLLVRWPAASGEARRLTNTVSTMDIAPTVLQAAGVAIPDDFEGRTLMPFLLGAERPGPSVAFSDFLDDRRVLTAGRWKFILRGNLTWTMFDLERDPNERNQLDERSADPIGLRYTRNLLGQFLGAGDRRVWLSGGSSEERSFDAQPSAIDDQLCRQLAALGYVDPRCGTN